MAHDRNTLDLDQIINLNGKLGEAIAKSMLWSLKLSDLKKKGVKAKREGVSEKISTRNITRSVSCSWRTIIHQCDGTYVWVDLLSIEGPVVQRSEGYIILFIYHLQGEEINWGWAMDVW
jgi:hypothetical protein